MISADDLGYTIFDRDEDLRQRVDKVHEEYEEYMTTPRGRRRLYNDLCDYRDEAIIFKQAFEALREIMPCDIITFYGTKIRMPEDTKDIIKVFHSPIIGDVFTPSYTYDKETRMITTDGGKNIVIFTVNDK